MYFFPCHWVQPPVLQPWCVGVWNVQVGSATLLCVVPANNVCLHNEDKPLIYLADILCFYYLQGYFLFVNSGIPVVTHLPGGRTVQNGTDTLTIKE